MSDVILQVTEISVATSYAAKRMNLTPVGDLLYAIDVPDEEYVEKDGQRVLTLEGMRHIINGASVALIVEAERGDF